MSVHDPALQKCPLGHAAEQLPQWLVSVERFTQTPPQFVVPVPQQTPDWQVVPPGQVFPHEPQLLGSALVSTQPDGHAVGAAGGQAHAPAAQTRPPVHEIAQPPQSLGLDPVSTQTPPQLVVPAAQHTPDEQVVPLAHVVLQPPQ
jgi:hypothetical protein